MTSKVDPSKKPAWLDITFVVPEDGETEETIFRVEGDTLTTCFGDGGARPDDFGSKESDGRILAVYEKVKKWPPQRSGQNPCCT